MGIKRNDLAQGRKPCVECNGVGTVPAANTKAGVCKNCKGVGWAVDAE
jgi:DnaJ-class molecular chaperone